MDLATGHVNAIDKIKENPGVKVYNLGTGKGYSVLDVIKNFSEASGIDIPYVITDRRPGDIAECYSDATLAKEELGWEAKYDIHGIGRRTILTDTDKINYKLLKRR